MFEAFFPVQVCFNLTSFVFEAFRFVEARFCPDTGSRVFWVVLLCNLLKHGPKWFLLYKSWLFEHFDANFGARTCFFLARAKKRHGDVPMNLPLIQYANFARVSVHIRNVKNAAYISLYFSPSDGESWW